MTIIKQILPSKGHAIQNFNFSEMQFYFTKMIIIQTILYIGEVSSSNLQISASKTNSDRSRQIIQEQSLALQKYNCLSM